MTSYTAKGQLFDLLNLGMKDLDWSAGTVCEEKVRNTTKKGEMEKTE